MSSLALRRRPPPPSSDSSGLAWACVDRTGCKGHQAPAISFCAAQWQHNYHSDLREVEHHGATLALKSSPAESVRPQREDARPPSPPPKSHATSRSTAKKPPHRLLDGAQGDDYGAFHAKRSAVGSPTAKKATLRPVHARSHVTRAHGEAGDRNARSTPESTCTTRSPAIRPRLRRSTSKNPPRRPAHGETCPALPRRPPARRRRRPSHGKKATGSTRPRKKATARASDRPQGDRAAKTPPEGDVAGKKATPATKPRRTGDQEGLIPTRSHTLDRVAVRS